MLTAQEAHDWFKGVTVPLATIFHKDGCQLLPNY